jgi:hypothetical protein
MMNHYPTDMQSKHGRAYLIFIHVAFGLLIAVSLSLLLGLFVKLLWNGILPDLLGVPPMTYLQSVGLLLLSRILVGGFSHGKGGFRRPHGGRWREYDEWWKEKGEKSFREFSNDQPS